LLTVAAPPQRGTWRRPRATPHTMHQHDETRLLRFARNDGRGRADAIVVLGCRLKPDGSPSGSLRRRVALGVRLYQEGAAPILLLSGGGTGPCPEAAAMQDLALAAGVPESALLVEAESRNTSENARNSARLLRADGKSRVLLVSDRLHLPRAALLFRLAGMKVVGRAGIPARLLCAAILLLAYEVAALPGSVVRGLWRGLR